MRRHLPSRRAVERITSARPSLSEDVHGRQRRYMFAMVVRVACLAAGVACWHSLRVLALIMLAGGAVIPFVAVVFANGGRARPSSGPAAVPASAGGPRAASTEVVVHTPTAVVPGPPPSPDPEAQVPPAAPLEGRVIRWDEAC